LPLVMLLTATLVIFGACAVPVVWKVEFGEVAEMALEFADITSKS
jgi:hypothetical protein